MKNQKNTGSTQFYHNLYRKKQQSDENIQKNYYSFLQKDIIKINPKYSKEQLIKLSIQDINKINRVYYLHSMCDRIVNNKYAVCQNESFQFKYAWFGHNYIKKSIQNIINYLNDQQKFWKQDRLQKKCIVFHIVLEQNILLCQYFRKYCEILVNLGKANWTLFAIKNNKIYDLFNINNQVVQLWNNNNIKNLTATPILNYKLLDKLVEFSIQKQKLIQQHELIIKIQYQIGNILYWKLTNINQINSEIQNTDLFINRHIYQQKLKMISYIRILVLNKIQPKIVRLLQVPKISSKKIQKMIIHQQLQQEINNLSKQLMNKQEQLNSYKQKVQKLDTEQDDLPIPSERANFKIDIYKRSISLLPNKSNYPSRNSKTKGNLLQNSIV